MLNGWPLVNAFLSRVGLTKRSGEVGDALGAVIGKIRFKSWGFKMSNVSNEEKRYDFIAVGAGAASSVLAGIVRMRATPGHRVGMTRRRRPSRTRAVVEFVEQIVDLEQEMKS